jgi:hypothetical protein
MLAAGVALASTATATADPEPQPADPGFPTPPPPSPSNPAIDNPLTGFANFFLNSTGGDLMLSQSAVPALPGSAPFSPPNVDLLQPTQLLLPQNYRVPPPDQVSPYPLAEGEPGPFARVDALKGVHAILHGALGRMPAAELGQPLPGTAPPPGTNIPAGPEQFLPDPAALAPPPPAPAG